MVIPAFFTSIWFWLYAGCGFILKGARHFDLGFDWFNRKFDIEEKAPSSLASSLALVAIIYFGFALTLRAVTK